MRELAVIALGHDLARANSWRAAISGRTTCSTTTRDSVV